MHHDALKALVRSVLRRASQGDYPTEPPLPRETMEEMVIALVKLQPEIDVHKMPEDAGHDTAEAKGK